VKGLNIIIKECFQSVTFLGSNWKKGKERKSKEWVERGKNVMESSKRL
jgi:hypothetical protein